MVTSSLLKIIKYIPLQQGLRQDIRKKMEPGITIIKYIPLQQGLRRSKVFHYLIITYY